MYIALVIHLMIKFCRSRCWTSLTIGFSKQHNFEWSLFEEVAQGPSQMWCLYWQVSGNAKEGNRHAMHASPQYCLRWGGCGLGGVCSHNKHFSWHIKGSFNHNGVEATLDLLKGPGVGVGPLIWVAIMSCVTNFRTMKLEWKIYRRCSTVFVIALTSGSRTCFRNWLPSRRRPVPYWNVARVLPLFSGRWRTVILAHWKKARYWS